MKQKRKTVLTGAFAVLIVLGALLPAGSVVAGEMSDVTTVSFNPKSVAMHCGGASKTIEVTFYGTTNIADSGGIKVNIVEEDWVTDDPLIELRVNCDPALPQNQNFKATVKFRLKCDAECYLWGDSVLDLPPLERTC